MKLFVFFITTVGFALVGCQDERGFRAKPFPSTAAQAREQACGSTVCPEKVQPKKQDTGDTNQSNGGSQAPVKPGSLTPPAPAAPPPVPDDGKQSGNNNKPVAQPTSQADEVFDAAALAMNDDPTVPPEVKKKKFRENFTPDRSKIADDVIQGFYMKLSTDNTYVMVQANINDDGTVKSLVAYGELSPNAKPNTKFPLISNLEDIASADGFFCTPPQCKANMFGLILTVNVKDKGPIRAVFYQTITDDGQPTQIMSSIDTTKPFDKKPFAIESTTSKVQNTDPDNTKGDSAPAVDDGATAKNLSAWQTIMYRLKHHGQLPPKADDSSSVDKSAPDGISAPETSTAPTPEASDSNAMNTSRWMSRVRNWYNSGKTVPMLPPGATDSGAEPADQKPADGQAAPQVPADQKPADNDTPG